ncbi:MAG: hypothetical protein COA36_04235 [Desulfotalea sp.]|nr:MAG: hypothetical protein COA36_04235 [Desulfotalea sp.]
MNKPIDVRHFFLEITHAYEVFHENVDTLSHNLPSYSPPELTVQFQKLDKKRNNLSRLDKELIQIVRLAGDEIEAEPFVDDYRTAFSLATAACDNLQQSLQLLRFSLLSKNKKID